MELTKFYDENVDVSKIVEICSQLVGSEISPDDIEISGFSAGLVNLIKKVTFKQQFGTIPQSVVVKVYQEGSSESQYDIKVSAENNQVIGEAGIGPKVLLARPDTIVLEFVESRVASKKDDHNEAFRRALAKQLARFHALPVSQARATPEDILNGIYEGWLSKDMLKSLQEGDLRKALGESSHLNADAFEAEVSYVKSSILQSTEYPLAFAHQDLNHTNILVELPECEEYKLRFIDFDYCCHYYRGVDFGGYFLHAGQEEDYILDDKKELSDEKMLQFIRWYNEEMVAQRGESYAQDPLNAPEKMLKEAKMFILHSYLVTTIFMMYISQMEPKKAPGYMQYADSCFEGYLKAKKRYQDENAVPK